MNYNRSFLTRFFLLATGLFAGFCLFTGVSFADGVLRTARHRTVDIRHLRLDLDVNMKGKAIQGTATITFTPLKPIRSLTLDAVDHIVSMVEHQNGSSLRKLVFHNTGKKLVLTFPGELPAGSAQTVTVHYQIRNPRTGLHFFGPTAKAPKIPEMLWSQGEPLSNRYWFPSVDAPNERQTSEMIVRVDSGFEVLSNGRLLSRQKIDKGRRERFHWKQDKPHSSYLVTLVVGRFAVHREKWRGKPVTYYVAPDRLTDVRHTFGRTREMMEFFSKRFGIAYPWPKYAQVVVEQFTSGGMENTSATTLYRGVMHDSRALIDHSPDRLIAHELGHQWWGDLVTCRDWAHLWLNEGFATYCEVLWYEHKLGKDERDYLLFRKSRSARGGTTKTRPIVDRRYSHPRDMFDSRAYPKGGWVLHMLRNRVGDDLFFRALKRYGTLHAYQTTETADLRKVFESLTGSSLKRFFYDWTERAGHPLLEVTSRYDPRSHILRVDIVQRQQGEAFHLPLKLQITPAGMGMPLTIEKRITQKQQTFFIPMPKRPQAIHIDPRQSLLAEIRETKDRDWWIAQLRQAPTVAERIRAVEHFGKSKRDADLKLLAAVLKHDPFYGVRIEAAIVLGKTRGSVSRDALLAGVSQSLPKVRTACIKALGAFPKDKAVLALLKRKERTGDVSYFVESAVIRTLAKIQKTVDFRMLTRSLTKDSYSEVIRQAAIAGLPKTNHPQAVNLLLEWTHRDKPRRCRLAALQAIPKSIAAHTVPAAKITAVRVRLEACLQDVCPRVRRAAGDALGLLGIQAEPALAGLKAVADSDADYRTRKSARTAIGKITAAVKIETAHPGELQRLRRRVKELEAKNKKLEQQIRNRKKKRSAKKGKSSE